MRFPTASPDLKRLRIRDVRQAYSRTGLKPGVRLFDPIAWTANPLGAVYASERPLQLFRRTASLPRLIGWTAVTSSDLIELGFTRLYIRAFEAGMMGVEATLPTKDCVVAYHDGQRIARLMADWTEESIEALLSVFV